MRTSAVLNTISASSNLSTLLRAFSLVAGSTLPRWWRPRRKSTSTRCSAAANTATTARVALTKFCTTARLQHDINHDTFLSKDEMKDWATAAIPGEEWDDSFWDPMCTSHGADPAKGFTKENFCSLMVEMRRVLQAAAYPPALAYKKLFAECDIGACGPQSLYHMLARAGQLSKLLLAAAAAAACADGDGLLNEKEMQQACHVLAPAGVAEWDSASWVGMCGDYGVESTAAGFTLGAFKPFYDELKENEHPPAPLPPAAAPAQPEQVPEPVAELEPEPEPEPELEPEEPPPEPLDTGSAWGDFHLSEEHLRRAPADTN